MYTHNIWPWTPLNNYWPLSGIGHWTEGTQGLGAAAANDCIWVPLWVPLGYNVSFTNIGVQNSDTTTDASFSAHFYLFDSSAATNDWGPNNQLYDFGTIGKDTTATTTVRVLSTSPFSTVTLTHGLYWLAQHVTVAKAGASGIFKCQLPIGSGKIDSIPWFGAARYGDRATDSLDGQPGASHYPISAGVTSMPSSDPWTSFPAKQGTTKRAACALFYVTGV